MLTWLAAMFSDDIKQLSTTQRWAK